MSNHKYYDDLLSSHLDRMNDQVSECTLIEEATEAVIGYCLDWGLEPNDFVIKHNTNKTFTAGIH